MQGYLPTSSLLFSAVLPSLPFFVLVAALLILPGMRSLDLNRDPLATIDPPPPPVAASSRAPSMDRIIRRLWWIVLAVFIVSMLTWIPKTWEGVFNSGIALFDRSPVHHADHRHGRATLPLPGHVGRRGCVHRRHSWRTTSD